MVTTIEDGMVWQRLLVTLAPAIPGAAVFVLSLVLFFLHWQDLDWTIFCYVFTSLSGIWLLMCCGDFRDARDLLRSVYFDRYQP